jgi:hypothetical protein
MGFTQMTPVQAAAIPLFMKNKDVVVEVYEMYRTMKINALDTNLCGTGCHWIRKDSFICHTSD